MSNVIFILTGFELCVFTALLFKCLFAVPELEVEPGYEVTNHSLVLHCHTQGLPVTAALFSKDGILLGGQEEGLVSSSFPLTQEGGGSHREAAYENSLSLADPSVTGLFSCDIHSDWVMANKTESGRKSKSICTNL